MLLLINDKLVQASEDLLNHETSDPTQVQFRDTNVNDDDSDKTSDIESQENFPITDSSPSQILLANEDVLDTGSKPDTILVRALTDMSDDLFSNSSSCTKKKTKTDVSISTSNSSPSINSHLRKMHLKEQEEKSIQQATNASYETFQKESQSEQEKQRALGLTNT